MTDNVQRIAGVDGIPPIVDESKAPATKNDTVIVNETVMSTVAQDLDMGVTIQQPEGQPEANGDNKPSFMTPQIRM